MLKKTFVVIVASIAVLAAGQSAAAQTKVRVRFNPGTSGGTYAGVVKGYKYRDYLIPAKGGQTLFVELTTSHEGLEFIVRNPSGENLTNGETEFSTALERSGTYVVRVLMPRAYARRRESAVFKITFKID